MKIPFSICFALILSVLLSLNFWINARWEITKIEEGESGYSKKYWCERLNKKEINCDLYSKEHIKSAWKIGGIALHSILILFIGLTIFIEINGRNV